MEAKPWYTVHQYTPNPLELRPVERSFLENLPGVQEVRMSAYGGGPGRPFQYLLCVKFRTSEGRIYDYMEPGSSFANCYGYIRNKNPYDFPELPMGLNVDPQVLNAELETEVDDFVVEDQVTTLRQKFQEAISNGLVENVAKIREELIEALETEMALAIAAEAYEEAGEIRDEIAVLQS